MTSCIMTTSSSLWLLSLLFIVFLCQVRGQGSDWVERPRSVAVAVGGSASFVCKAPGLNPSIVWTKGTTVIFINGRRFSDTVPARYTLLDNFTLSISDVQRSDNDMYGCNVQDSGSASANLTVLLPPGPPTLSTDLSGDVYREGQRVEFRCQSRGGNPAPTISWLKNGLPLATLGATATTGATTLNRLTRTLDHSDHQANYSCVVYNQVNQQRPLLASRLLHVQYAPIVTFEQRSPYTVLEGSSVNVTCQADAVPPVSSATWLKDGAPLSGSSLVRYFSSVQRDDAANYTCSASNLLNRDQPSQASIVLHVVYPPFITIPSNRTVPELSPLSILCVVDANPFPYQIVWEKVVAGGRVEQRSGSERLEFSAVRREDSGNYSCRADSLLQISDSPAPQSTSSQAFMTLHVQYAPGAASISPVSGVDVDQPLTLTCTAQPPGYPPASFEWRRDGQQLSYRGSSYTVPSASFSDSGLYECSPFNSAGHGAAANVSVTVNDPPRLLQGLPEDMTRTISSTQPLTFTCSAQGRPQPVVQWLREGGEGVEPQWFSVNTTTTPSTTHPPALRVASTLTFQGPGRDLVPGKGRVQLRIEDMGNYTCRVSSPVHDTTPSSTVQLKVQFAPVSEGRSHKVAVTVTDSCRVTCRVQAFPPPDFLWTRTGRPLTLSPPRLTQQQGDWAGVLWGYQSQLIFTSVHPDDYGLYHCTATNHLNNLTLTVNLTTKSLPEAPVSVVTLWRGWDAILLRWTPGFDGGFPQRFQLMYSQEGGGSAVVPPQPLNTTQFNVTGLRPSTRYLFSVFGRNELGEGQHSMQITSQTRALDLPVLDGGSVVFHAASQELEVGQLPGDQFCLKVDARDEGGRWRTVKQCTRQLGSGRLKITEVSVQAVNVSVCLVQRPEVCGPPVTAHVASTKGPTLTVREVIIIACVCAFIIITLLIILICFICRRRKANAKEYENSEIPPSQGGLAGKKMQQPGQPPQTYDNAGMVLHESPAPASSNGPLSPGHVSCGGRYPALPAASDQPPNYWDTSRGQYPPSHSPPPDALHDPPSMDLHPNHAALYGRMDDYRGHQESGGVSGGAGAGGRSYLELEDRKDPSLQSQESGYSTGDPGKKKVIYEVVV